MIMSSLLGVVVFLFFGWLQQRVDRQVVRVDAGAARDRRRPVLHHHHHHPIRRTDEHDHARSGSLAAWPSLALIVAACGGDDDDDAAADTTRRRRRPTRRHDRGAGDDRRGDDRRRPTAPATERLGDRGRRRRRPVGRLPGPARDPDRLVPRGRARRALRDGRRGLHGRHRQEGRVAARSSPAAQETGIDIEIRTGGPAIGYQPVSRPAVRRRQHHARLRQHRGPDPALGRARRCSSVVAPLEINPQIIMWDPETYPDVETLADLGEEDVTINVFAGGDVRRRVRRRGHLERGPGRPVLRRQPGPVHRRGRRRSPSRASPRPSRTPTRTCSRSGASRSPTSCSTTPASRSTRRRWRSCPTSSRSCGRAWRRSSRSSSRRPVDFVDDPGRANAIIIDAVEQYDTFWIYDAGPRRVLGEDPARARPRRQRPRRHARQHRRGAGPGRASTRSATPALEVPDDLTAADLFTNEFIDPSIGLP